MHAISAARNQASPASRTNVDHAARLSRVRARLEDVVLLQFLGASYRNGIREPQPPRHLEIGHLVIAMTKKFLHDRVLC